MIRDDSAANLLLLIAGFVVWGSAFNMLYGAFSVGCAFGWHEVRLGPVSLQRTVLVAVWLGHLALIGALLAWTRRRRRRAASDGNMTAAFFRRAVGAATVVAAVVTFLNFAPILVLSACV